MSDPIFQLNDALSGRYRIERKVGEGGMATVYLADDVRHARQVALKVLKPELAAAIGPERFLAEIRTTASLQHPHILPLFDSGEADGFLYYVMPYVAGETLRERLRREGQLPVHEAVDIARKVASALHEAHEQGIVHRDVKPSNILLAKGEPLVADFGIALAVGEREGTRLTDTGMSIGTPAYMSPEQGVETGSLDRRSDIYSLGCVLYEMLTGDPPFTGSNPMAVLVRKSVEAPPRITTVRASVSSALEAVVVRALARTPADRFDSARRFSDAVADAQSHPSVVEASPTRRSWWPAGALLAVAAVGGLSWFAAGNRADPSASDDRIEAVAVLPFANFSGEARRDVVDGLHAMLVGELHQLDRLSTRSRSSVLRFAADSTSLDEVSRELDVDAVVEGFVTLVGGSLRLQVNLLRVRPSESAIWSQEYETEVEELFSLLDQVVLDLSRHLGDPAVDMEERAAPVERDAVFLYARARSQFDSLDSPTALRTAISLLDSASALDPQFAAALAWESLAHSWTWWFGFDQSEERIALARLRSDSSLALDPDLPSARMARGFIHSVEGRTDLALVEYRRALSDTPGDPTLLRFMGIANRAEGNWELAASNFVSAASDDPASSIWVVEGALTLIPLRAWTQVLQMAELAEQTEPVDSWVPLAKARALLELDGGDTDRALEVMTRGVERFGPEPYLGFEGFLLPYLATLDGELFQRLDEATDTAVFFNLPGLLSFRSATLHEMRGDSARARELYEEARLKMEPLFDEGRLRQDVSVRAAFALKANMAIAHAALDRVDEAPDDVAEWLSDPAFPRDPIAGLDQLKPRAHVALGNYSVAIDLLREALERESTISVTTLRLNPWFAPLRGMPEFQALLEGG